MLLFPIAPRYADVISFAEANPWVTDSLPFLTTPFFDRFSYLFASFEPSKTELFPPAEACCPPPCDGEVLVDDKGDERDAPPNASSSSISHNDSSEASAACAAVCDEQRISPDYSRSFDVAGFVAGEITVKAVGNCVEVHAGHLEKPPPGEEGDYVRREYTHRFTLPDDVKHDSITSVLTEEGTLVVRAVRSGHV